MTAPANDNMASAIAIFGQSGSVAGTLTGSTLDTADSGSPYYLGSHIEGTVWYAWTAPISGKAVFQTGPGNASLDTTLDVFLDGNRLAYNDDSGASLMSKVTLLVSEGSVYDVRVGCYAGHADSGDFTLSWSVQRAMPAPANDNKASAAVISGQSGSVTGTLAGSTLEPDLDDSYYAGTVWYAWKAPVSGGIQFRADGASDSIELDIYMNDSWISSGSDFQNNDGTWGSDAVLLVTKGRVYYVRVGSRTEIGGFRLAWSPMIGNRTFSKPFTTLIVDLKDIESYYDLASVNIALFGYGVGQVLDIPPFAVSDSPNGRHNEIYLSTTYIDCPSTGDRVEGPLLTIRRNVYGTWEDQQFIITFSAELDPAMIGISVNFNYAT